MTNTRNSWLGTLSRVGPRSLWKWVKASLFVSGPVVIGERFHLGIFSFVSAPRELVIGQDVYIGKFCTIQCNGSIGSGVLIANNVGIVGRRDHDIRAVGTAIRKAPWVGDTPRLAEDPRNKIEICDDVWIGYGAVLISGITIGRGAVVAAGSVVSESVAAYDIVSGNPARPVGRRFADAVIPDHEAALSQAAP